MCREIARSGTPRACCDSAYGTSASEYLDARAGGPLVAEHFPVELRKAKRIVIRKSPSITPSACASSRSIALQSESPPLITMVSAGNSRFSRCTTS